MRALLDVNVLIAMHDAGHANHHRARAWFAANREHGWASCAITQNGFVRVISQPQYPLDITTAQAVSLLAKTCSSPAHQFWGCAPSLLDSAVIDSRKIHGPTQITDAYLLALAVYQGGRLVTFDHKVALTSVVEAKPDHLTVV